VRSVLSAGDERQRRPAAQRRTASSDTDHDRGDREHPDTSQPEGLFTDLESAMDAASAHLLSAEAVVDTTSPYGANLVDRMVSLSIIVIPVLPSWHG